MSLQVAISELDHHLAEYLKKVEKGGEIIITRRGKPIVKIISATQENSFTHGQEAAWHRTMNRLKKGCDLKVQKFNRDELYDRHR